MRKQHPRACKRKQFGRGTLNGTTKKKNACKRRKQDSNQEAILLPDYDGIITRRQYKTMQVQLTGEHETSNTTASPMKLRKRKSSAISVGPIKKKFKGTAITAQPSCSKDPCGGGSQNCGCERTDRDFIENLVNTTLCSFPDCDPDYIKDRLVSSNETDSSRLKKVLEHLKKNHSRYPRKKDEIKRKRMEILHALPFDIEEFIYRYPTPDKQSRISDQRCVESNIDTALVYFGNEFRYLPVPYIQDRIRKIPLQIAYALLKEQNTRRAEQVTEEHNRQRDMEYSEARLKNELIECPICLALVIQEELFTCGKVYGSSHSQHLFCKQCLSLSAREGFAQGKMCVSCLFPTCTDLMPVPVLQKALPYDLFTTAMDRAVQEELRQANIEELVTCPHCTYSVIFPTGSTQTILQCENPKCLATTCRLCNKPSHGPFDCGKQENAKIELQKILEESMTEAVVRQCPKCSTPFIKEFGCNTMTCSSCSAQSCYACRQMLVSGHKHFKLNSSCRRINAAEKLHARDVKKAYMKADQKYRKRNILLDGIPLDVDLLKEWEKE